MKDNDNFDEEKIIDEVVKEDIFELLKTLQPSEKQIRNAPLRKNIIFTVFFIVMILFFAIIAVDCIMQISDFFKNNSSEDIIDTLKIFGICLEISAVFYGIFHLLKKKGKAFYGQSELSLIGFALCCVIGLCILGFSGFVIFSELRD